MNCFDLIAFYTLEQEVVHLYSYLGAVSFFCSSLSPLCKYKLPLNRMVNWLFLSFGFLSASACLSVIMLRRLLRQNVLFCNCLAPTKPRRAVVTGATSGLGLATARELCRMGWSLVLGCRDIAAGAAVKEQLIRECGTANVSVYHLDLNNFYSIAHFARELPLSEPIEVLISNAGIMASRCIKPSSNHNIDSNMLTNFVGPFCLFKELLPHFKLAKCSPKLTSLPRVVFVSSALGARGELSTTGTTMGALPIDKWTPRLSYANSKQALNLCAQEIMRRYGSGDDRLVDVYTVVTGGMVNTNLNRDMLADVPFTIKWMLQRLSGFVLKTPEEGCQSIIHCAVSSDVFGAHLSKEDCAKLAYDNSGSGWLYRNCIPVEWPESAQSSGLARAVYAEAEAIYAQEMSEH